MNNKRVLITGGAGLVGSHIAELVAAQSPREIVVLDNLVCGRRDNLRAAGAIYPITIVTGDVLDAPFLARVMKGIDIVFHQAAPSIAQCVEDPRHALDVLVSGTSNVLQAAAQARVAKVVRACLASKLALVEQCSTLGPDHCDNNFALEEATEGFNKNYGLRCVTLRYSTVYGPRISVQNAEVLIRWMESIEAGQLPRIGDDGLQAMDLIDVRDVARANLLAAVADVGDEIFDIVTGFETSPNLLARRLAVAMGVSTLR